MSLEDADEVRITTTIVAEGTSFLDDNVVVRPLDHWAYPLRHFFMPRYV